MWPNLLALLALSAGAATVPDEYPTLQEAVDNTPAGGLIEVAPGTYTESVFIDRDLTIRGTGHAVDTVFYPLTQPGILEVAEGVTAFVSNLTLDGDGYARGVTGWMGAQVQLEDVRCRNGVRTSGDGGCVWMEGSGGLALVRSRFEDSVARSGGHVYVGPDSILYVEESRFLRGEALDGGGGAIVLGVGSEALVGFARFDGNHASGVPFEDMGGAGGAITSFGNLQLIGSWFHDNSADFWAGGVFAAQGTLEVHRGGFVGNHSSEHVGAVFSFGASQAFFDRVSVVDNHTPGLGGALVVVETPLTEVKRSWFVQNEAGASGGAVYTEFSGFVDVQDSVFRSNVAGSEGGAMASDYGADQISLQRNYLCANEAQMGGALAYRDLQEANLIGNTLLYNQGGSLYQFGGLLQAEHNYFLSSSWPGDGVHLRAEGFFEGYSYLNVFGWARQGTAVYGGPDAFVESMSDWYYDNDVGNVEGNVFLLGTHGGTPHLRSYDPFVINCRSRDVRPQEGSPFEGTGVGPWGSSNPPRWYEDNDGDGFTGIEDCDDWDDQIHPDTTWYLDADGDGYGDAANSQQSCVLPGADWVLNSDDCDDDDPRYHELITVYDDQDDDGYGDPATAQQVCGPQPVGTVLNGDDCDDTDATLHPETVWYADADGDGYGDPTDAVVQCEPPPGYVLNNLDCDDTDPTINPETIWYADADGDGYGDPDSFVQQCVQPSGYVANDLDCDDTNPGVHPDATEVCDGIDNNCDGLTDIGAVDAAIWAPDADGDGFGDDTRAVAICDPPADWTQVLGDCDDDDDTVYPGATEYCNGVDNDCNGIVDDNAVDEQEWFTDADGDGWGDDEGGDTVTACDPPAGYGPAGDCDDTDPEVHPDATEVCDGIDNNCSGLIDDEDPALDLSTTTDWYPDADGDGAGDADAEPVQACEGPEGYVDNNLDCDDTDPEVTSCEEDPGPVPSDHDAPSNGKADQARPEGPSRYGVGCQHGGGSGLPAWTLWLGALALMRRRTG